MTNIWEQNIREWYEKSETSRLNYLDLASIEKPSTKELAHNIAVIYDRVCLSSKVNLKEFRNQQLQIQSIEESVQQLGTKIEKLLPGGNFSLRFGDYVAAQQADPVLIEEEHYQLPTQT